ncbi:MAG: hypothetical protein IJP03_02640 [Christensenellaceae bacterium]|nr:hypothetical protein [Christensenellaceae bacterium]
MQAGERKLLLVEDHGRRRVLVLRQAEGERCRVVLQDARPGEQVLLMAKDGRVFPVGSPEGQAGLAAEEVAAGAVVLDGAICCVGGREAGKETQKAFARWLEEAQKKQPSPPPPKEDAVGCNCGFAPKKTQEAPFADIFPEGSWRRVEYPAAAGWHYLEGEICKNGQLRARALALPGEYAISPPPWLKGFDSFLQAGGAGKGYWLLLEDPATGRPLSLQAVL